MPSDTTALSLGADDLARRIATALPDAQIIRSGSRGAAWLEPLLEWETAAGWVGFANADAWHVEEILDQGEAHSSCIGLVDAHPWFSRQERLTFSRIGQLDPLSLADYESERGFAGLRNALTLTPEEIVRAVTESGLRGRGGAAFPTGSKWQTVLDAGDAQKYVVCNADEGDSGTFADRLIMECDPFLLIEGMVISGLAVGATKGFIYLRREYPLAHRRLLAAIDKALEDHWLGNDIQGSGSSFHLEVRLGADAYICGEETSLLESLEGRRGTVRAKPPLPAVRGLFDRPTVVNNVLSLAAIPFILDQGAQAYADAGSGRSRGTISLQLSGNLLRGGLVEVPFGLSLREVLEHFGGGSATGRPLRAVQVGGPLGAYFPESLWDIPIDYEAFLEAGGVLGHGGIVAFDDTVDMAEQAEFSMAFCAHESCGKCTPCRIGSVRGAEVISRIRSGERVDENLELLDELCQTMLDGSLCALGGMAPIPVRSAVRHFPEDFRG